MKGYHQSLDHVANSVTEYQYFISERKKYTVNSTANMEIREGEYLDMTYLNSILIRYVIRTKKGWKCIYWWYEDSVCRYYSVFE